jgi:hypothetical protein
MILLISMFSSSAANEAGRFISLKNETAGCWSFFQHHKNIKSKNKSQTFSIFDATNLSLFVFRLNVFCVYGLYSVSEIEESSRWAQKISRCKHRTKYWPVLSFISFRRRLKYVKSCLGGSFTIHRFPELPVFLCSFEFWWWTSWQLGESFSI